MTPSQGCEAMTSRSEDLDEVTLVSMSKLSFSANMAVVNERRLSEEKSDMLRDSVVQLTIMSKV